MPKYSYKARDRLGMVVDGSIEAPNEWSVAEDITSLGYRLISIHPQRQWTKKLLDFLQKFQRVSQKETVLLCRQLGTLLKAGLPLRKALASILEQTTNQKLSEALNGAVSDIDQGVSFSDSLEKYPQVFNALFVNMVRVGETTGRLDTVLQRLADLNEQEYELRMRVKAALTYPVILVFAAVAIVGFLLVEILPKFVVVFDSYDAKLPAATTILLGISAGLKNFWAVILIVIVGAAVWMRKILATEDGQYRFQKMIFHVPVWGGYYLRYIVSQFTRTLGAMIHVGVPILQALTVAEQTVGNKVLAKVIGGIKTAVSAGKPFSEPMRASGVFPPMVVQMITAGEQSGKVDDMLIEIASYYEQETEYAIKRATAILEPVLLLVMGGVVAFIALSILLPIFNLIRVFRSGI